MSRINRSEYKEARRLLRDNGDYAYRWIAQEHGHPIVEELRVGGAIDEHDARLIAAAPDLLAALERLSFAAECRDNTMGDACRLIEVKAELASANQQARAAIAKATGA